MLPVVGQQKKPEADYRGDDEPKEVDGDPHVAPSCPLGRWLLFGRRGMIHFHPFVFHVFHHHGHHVLALGHVRHHLLTHGGVSHHRMHVFHAAHAFHRIRGLARRWRCMLMLRSLNCRLRTRGGDGHAYRKSNQS